MLNLLNIVSTHHLRKVGELLRITQLNFESRLVKTWSFGFELSMYWLSKKIRPDTLKSVLWNPSPRHLRKKYSMWIRINRFVGIWKKMVKRQTVLSELMNKVAGNSCKNFRGFKNWLFCWAIKKTRCPAFLIVTFQIRMVESARPWERLSRETWGLSHAFSLGKFHSPGIFQL